MSGAVAAVAPVRAPRRTWGSELRAVRVVWRRELIRAVGDRAQILTWLIQPLLFLFALGGGLESIAGPSTGGVEMTTFMFPGALCLAVLFTAMISAASIAWDRELGFLREMMVAPVRRSSIVLGKVLGGATIASCQGVLMLALAGLAGVPYDPLLMLGVLAAVVLLAFTMTACGVMVAVGIRRIQSFTAVMQVIVIPMFFLSGALFPVAGLPDWLEVLNRADPLTYAVDLIRGLVFGGLDASAEARAALDPGVTWSGWQVPAPLEAAMVLAAGAAMLALAIRRFSRTE